MAQRLSGYINEVLNFAVNGGLIAFNPCLKMGKNLKRVKKRNNPHITSEELPQLLKAINTTKIQTQTRLLLYFQLLTMARPSEACKAEWAEIDFNQKLWRIPAERMKAREPHIVPLSKQAIHILEQMHVLTGRFKYIFTKHGKGKKPLCL